MLTVKPAAQHDRCKSVLVQCWKCGPTSNAGHSSGEYQVSDSECCALLAAFDFFFQAEDGIRDLTVTGVQTCALPIFMAGNLTAQVRNIAEVSTAIAGGDLSKKITVNVSGEILQLKETINTMVDQLNAFAGEVTRVAREVGTEGRLGGQANVLGGAGTWKDLTDSVNSMASNLTAQVRNIAEVATAVANGDLSKKITVDVRGEILELKNTINTMVDQLNAFAGEVTRVAREVGTEGKL